MFYDISRPQKDLARSLAVSNNHDKPPAKCALFLPSTEFKCCLQAVEEGIIDDKTHLLLVERNKNYFPLMKSKYHELVKKGLLSKKATFFCADLHRIELDQNLPKIDYAFLDWFSELTEDSFGFVLQTLKNNLANGADIAFTFCLNQRKNKFANALATFVKNHKEIEDASKAVWDYSPNPKSTNILAAIRLAFHGFNFQKYCDPFSYNDTSYAMLCLRISNIRRCVECHFPLELINELEDLLDNYSLPDSVWIGKRTTKTNSDSFIPQRNENSESKALYVFLSCYKELRMIRGVDVIHAMMTATTPGKKAAATRLKNRFVEQRIASGKDPKWVEAGIKARIKRLQNGN